MSRRILLAVVAFGLLAVGGTAGSAAAGDGWSVIEFDPNNSTAEPGETVEIELSLSSHGSYGGEGLAEVDLLVEYNASYLTVTDVESAGWFEQDGEEVSVDSELEIDDEAGVVTYSEAREPAGDGTTGTAPVATLIVEVDEDAPPAETRLRAGDSTTYLAGGWQHPVTSRPAILTITEGGSTTDTAHSPVLGGIALLGALLAVHLVARRSE